MMSTWSSMSIITSMDHLLASPLRMYQPYLIRTLGIKGSTRFYQLSKTKLGLWPAMKSLRVSTSQIFSKILKFSLSFGRTPGAMILLVLSSVIASGNLSVNKIFD
jgi:hypothetical protein